MFSILARLVQRYSLLVILAWGLGAYALFRYAPPWDQVTKDDDVRFFPRTYPSVIGQELLERGFPRDAASSQLVLVYERPDGPLTPSDFAVVEERASDFHQFGQSNPDLGIKKLDTHRSPVIGPRLIGKNASGPGQAVLTIVSLRGTYLSKKTRLAVDRILDYLQKSPPLPQGLRRVVTGSAVVGHDMNTAANESIESTTWTTIALVVVILLIVYRSPLLAMIPLVTIALSVVVSLKGIALLTEVPGLTFQVINITYVFVVVVLFGAGTDYCLFLIARYREELARGRTRIDALREAITQVGAALVASAGTVIIGLGMLYFSSFAKIQYTGPAIALVAGGGLACGSDAGSDPARLAARRDLLALSPSSPCRGGRQGKGKPGSGPHDGLLAGSGESCGHAPDLDPGNLPGRTLAPGRHRRPDQVKLQPACGP